MTAVYCPITGRKIGYAEEYEIPKFESSYAENWDRIFGNKQMINLDEDEKIAKAATQGEWEHYEQKYQNKWLIGIRNKGGQRLFDYVQAYKQDDSPAFLDARHIANMNPSKTLEYIQCVRELRDALKAINACDCADEARLALLQKWGLE